MSNFLPLGKLLVYFAQSAVKPISSRIVNYTKDSPKFLKYCMWMANKNHKMYEKIGVWTGNKLPITEKLAEKHKNMTPEEAVDFFSNLLGEMIVISCGVGFVIWESKKRKKHRKVSNTNDELHSKRLDSIEYELGEIKRQLDAHI